MQDSYNLLLIENFFTKAMKEEIEKRNHRSFLDCLYVLCSHSHCILDSIKNSERCLAPCTAAEQVRTMRTFREGWEDVPKPKPFICCFMTAIHTHSPQSGSPLQGIPLAEIWFSLCTSGSRNKCCLLLRAGNWHLFPYSQHLPPC